MAIQGSGRLIRGSFGHSDLSRLQASRAGISFFQMLDHGQDVSSIYGFITDLVHEGIQDKDPHSALGEGFQLRTGRSKKAQP